MPRRPEKVPNDTFLIYMDNKVIFFSNFGASSCSTWLPCNLCWSYSWYNTLLILHNSMFLFSVNNRSLLIHVFCLLHFFPRFHVNNWRINKSLRCCGKPLLIHHFFRASNCRLLSTDSTSFGLCMDWLTPLSLLPLLLGQPLLILLLPCPLPQPNLKLISNLLKPGGDICSPCFPLSHNWGWLYPHPWLPPQLS